MSAPGPQRAVVLLSGGMDSAVALAIALERGFLCHTLTVDYGQRPRAELRAAELVADSLGVPPDRRRLLRMDLRAIGGSALTAPIDVPRAGQSAGIPVTYVPARNMLLLSLAVGYAETLVEPGAGEGLHVFIGANAIDYSGYPDCREAFLRAFEVAAKEGTAAGAAGSEVRVHAPLVAMSKAQIVREGARLGVDFSRTHSCYDPVEAPDGAPLACGRCDACALRRKGFHEAGAPDPTRYAANPL